MKNIKSYNLQEAEYKSKLKNMPDIEKVKLTIRCLKREVQILYGDKERINNHLHKVENILNQFITF